MSGNDDVVTTIAVEAEKAAEELRGVIVTTPLLESSVRPGKLFFKCETHQHTGSFKCRGAAARVRGVAAGRGVVAASTGNHGLATAWACRRLGIAATIYCPTTAAPTKLRGIERLGATLVQFGSDCVDAEVEARRVAQEQGKVFISPYNDRGVVVGQATCGVEIADQFRGVPDSCYVAVGGGGLIGGIGAVLKRRSSATRIVGCWAANSPVLLECLKAGSVIDVPETPTISDGTAGNIEKDSVTLPLCAAVIDERVVVTEEEICAAMRILAHEEKMVVEGAAAMCFAGFLKRSREHPDESAVVVLCGRNIDLSKWLHIVE